MINSFQKYMCSTCKSKMCDKGIALIKLDNMIIAKCTDYEKDENKVKGYDFGPYYLSNGAETLNTYLHNIDEKDVVRLPDCALGFVVRCHSKNEGIKVF